MNIKIQSVHFAADKQLKEFISKKVEKLISIDDSIINADVYLKLISLNLLIIKLSKLNCIPH